MSLADELLADLEEGGDEELESGEADCVNAVPDIDDVGSMETEDADVDQKSVRSVAKLLDGDEVYSILPNFVKWWI